MMGEKGKVRHTTTVYHEPMGFHALSLILLHSLTAVNDFHHAVMLSSSCLSLPWPSGLAVVYSHVMQSLLQDELETSLKVLPLSVSLTLLLC